MCNLRLDSLIKEYSAPRQVAICSGPPPAHITTPPPINTDVLQRWILLSLQQANDFTTVTSNCEMCARRNVTYIGTTLELPVLTAGPSTNLEVSTSGDRFRHLRTFEAGTESRIRTRQSLLISQVLDT